MSVVVQSTMRFDVGEHTALGVDEPGQSVELGMKSSGKSENRY